MLQAEYFKAAVNKQVQNDTTYYIFIKLLNCILLSEPVGSRMAKRTWKLFQGIALKKLIVNENWLIDSFKEGQFLPEVN